MCCTASHHVFSAVHIHVSMAPQRQSSRARSAVYSTRRPVVVVVAEKALDCLEWKWGVRLGRARFRSRSGLRGRTHARWTAHNTPRSCSCSYHTIPCHARRLWASGDQGRTGSVPPSICVICPRRRRRFLACTAADRRPPPSISGSQTQPEPTRSRQLCMLPPAGASPRGAPCPPCASAAGRAYQLGRPRRSGLVGCRQNVPGGVAVTHARGQRPCCLCLGPPRPARCSPNGRLR